MGRAFADALRAAGIKTKYHDDFFPKGTDDQHWLRDVGKRKWYVLTHDQNILERTPELRAVQTAGVGVFVITAKAQGPFSQKVGIFLNARIAIGNFIEKHPRPFIAHITSSGVTKAWPKDR